MLGEDKTHHPDLTWATICVFPSWLVVTEWQLTWDGVMLPTDELLSQRG